jgi:hypothetical protein
MLSFSKILDWQTWNLSLCTPTDCNRHYYLLSWFIFLIRNFEKFEWTKRSNLWLRLIWIIVRVQDNLRDNLLSGEMAIRLNLRLFFDLVRAGSTRFTWFLDSLNIFKIELVRINVFNWWDSPCLSYLHIWLFSLQTNTLHLLNFNTLFLYYYLLIFLFLSLLTLNSLIFNQTYLNWLCLIRSHLGNRHA